MGRAVQALLTKNHKTGGGEPMKKFGLVGTVTALLFTMGCSGNNAASKTPAAVQQKTAPATSADVEELWNRALNLPSEESSPAQQPAESGAPLEGKRKF